MFGKHGTRWLIALIVVLAAIWLLSEKFSTGAQQRTFRAEVITIDTNAVTRIAIRSPKTGPDGITLELRGTEWVAVASDREYRADEAAVRRLMRDFARVKTDHLMGSIDALRETYELTDSLGTRLEFTMPTGSRAVTIGKMSYGQQGAPQAAMNVPGEDQVFGVSAIITSINDLSINAFRPHGLVPGDPANWQRITFTYPADTGYVLEHVGTAWLVDSMPTDSGKVTKYLRSLALSKAQNFADTVNVGALVPTYQLTVEDSSRPDPIVVKVYPYGFMFIITSTANPGNVMYFDPSREMPRLFRPRQNWSIHTAPVPH